MLTQYKATMLTDSYPKVAVKYLCKPCDYSTSKKSSFHKHITTRKHTLLTSVNNELTASDALHGLASEESDKVYAKFYKVMYPTVVLASKGAKATPQDQMNLYKPEFIQEYGTTIDETIAFEKKTGKKVYTDDLIEEKKMFKQSLT